MAELRTWKVKTPKELAAKFFQEILELKDTKASSFVKAYRKSKPCKYEESIKLDTGEVEKIQVNAPGVMFVHLESEILHDQAISKARGLGGKRHPVLNYKYFVSGDECEAVCAAKECYKTKVQKIVTANKGKEDAQKTKFYFRGQDLVIAGKLHKEFLEPPTVEAVNSALLHERDALDGIKLYESHSSYLLFRSYSYNFRFSNW